MNNREIKFRARLLSDNTWIYFTLNELIIGRAKEFGLRAGEWCQFTGLKDKNGKEIYESDRVRARLFVNDSGTSGFIVEWNDKNASFQINGYPLNHYDELEVIGNIYED